MSTNTDNPDDRDQSFVEIYSTVLDWRDGRVQGVEVTVEYFDRDGNAAKNTVQFEVDRTGTARVTGLETPVSTLDDLRVLPAAEVVVEGVDGIEDGDDSFHVLEEQINAGYQAIDNRLDMTNVPHDLQAGYDELMEDDG